MASAADWLYRAAWDKRSAEFGHLQTAITVERDGSTRMVPVMQLGAGIKVVDQLWQRWQALPPHRVLLRVNRPGLLHFAAIDWTRRPIYAGMLAKDDAKVAGWGYQICDALQIVHARSGGEGAWFACPLVQCDLEGVVRMGFVSPGRDSWSMDLLPPEIMLDWPRCDELAFVYAAGQALRQLVFNFDPSSLLGSVIARAMHPIPTQRFETLAHMMNVLRDLGAQPSLRNSIAAPRRVWKLLEEGLGFYMYGDRQAAVVRFHNAFVRNPQFMVSVELRELASIPQDRIVSGELDAVPPPGPPPAWGPDPILRHDPFPEPPAPRRRGVFAYANGEMVRSVITTTPRADAAIAPADPIAFALSSRDYLGALSLVDTQLASNPDHARNHHLRGKALFALGRIADARAAFDRACTLDARLLEAMLLRREMDRAMKDAGTANRVVLKLPEHLAELRDILVAGRIVDAIQLLRRATYDDDRTAQLLLAELLVTDERHDDALAIFERLGDSLGKARTLLALARPAEALVALEGCDADDALELRSRILLALGRDDEAERAMDAYLSAVERRSDRRLESRGPESRADP